MSNPTNELHGLLSCLSDEELKDLLHSDQKFNEVTKNMIEKISEQDRGEKEMLIASNASLREYLINIKDTICVQKAEIIELYSRLAECKDSVSGKFSQLKESGSSSDPDTMLTVLHSSAVSLEGETDKLAESLLDGEVGFEAFLEQYVNERKLMYTRKIKWERITDINKQRCSYRSPARPAPPPPAVLSTSQNGLYPFQNLNATSQSQLPYPVGPPSYMPMPPSYVPNHF